MIFIIVFSLLVLSIIPAYVAYSKGRNLPLWYFVSIFIFPISLLYTLFMKSFDSVIYFKRKKVKCPNCQNSYVTNNKKCFECGTLVDIDLNSYSLRMEELIDVQKKYISKENLLSLSALIISITLYTGGIIYFYNKNELPSTLHIRDESIIPLVTDSGDISKPKLSSKDKEEINSLSKRLEGEWHGGPSKYRFEPKFDVLSQKLTIFKDEYLLETELFNINEKEAVFLSRVTSGTFYFAEKDRIIFVENGWALYENNNLVEKSDVDYKFECGVEFVLMGEKIIKLNGYDFNNLELKFVYNPFKNSLNNQTELSSSKSLENNMSTSKLSYDDVINAIEDHFGLNPDGLSCKDTDTENIVEVSWANPGKGTGAVWFVNIITGEVYDEFYNEIFVILN